jgi:hypothetical protein
MANIGKPHYCQYYAKEYLIILTAVQKNEILACKGSGVQGIRHGAWGVGHRVKNQDKNH